MLASEIGVVGELDDAAGVDYIVRCIEDAAGSEFCSMARVRQLIVGRSGNDAGMNIANRAVVDRAAKGAGRKHINVYGMNVMSVDASGAELIGGPVERRGVQIRHMEPGSCFVQQARQIVTNRAETLNGDVYSVQARVSPQLIFHSGTDTLKYAVCGVRRGVSA